jgi:microfibrillar-associated protein 1
MRDEDQMECEDKDFSVPLTFISKGQRVLSPADSSSSDEGGHKTSRRQIAVALKETVGPEASTHHDFFDEPPAPDTNDAATDQEQEYRMWVERETNRLRDEITVRAKYDLDMARTAQQRKMTDEELAEMRKNHPVKKGKMGYMQKYYHKGAYSVDGDRATEL